MEPSTNIQSISGPVPCPWSGKMALMLEGGGTRGYASLLMLDELMKRISQLEQEHPDESHGSSFGPGNQNPPEAIAQGQRELARNMPESTWQELSNRDGKYLPCHYFDYMGGTSTGGLNALMLGRLRMSVDECIRRYPEFAHNIFGMRRVSCHGLWRARYNCSFLEEEIKALVAERIPDGATNSVMDQLKSPDDLCRVVLVAKEISKDETSEKAYLFRTYDHHIRPHCEKKRGYHKNPGPAHTCEIWKVGRAISAAPTYLKPMEIEGVKYSDGGIMFNDPSEVVCLEICVKENYHDEPQSQPYPISLVLALGTGLRPTTRDKARGFLARQKHIQKIRNKTERVTNAILNPGPIEERMQQDMEKFEFTYCKWTGGAEVGGLSLDECKPTTFQKMDQWVRAYMRQPTVQKELEKVARELVGRRRERYNSTPDRWKRFTLCTKVRCPFCQVHETSTEAEAVEHFRSKHPTEIAGISSLETFVEGLAKCQPWMRGPW